MWLVLLTDRWSSMNELVSFVIYISSEVISVLTDLCCKNCQRWFEILFGYWIKSLLGTRQDAPCIGQPEEVLSTLWDRSKEVVWGGRSDLGVKLEDQLQLNLFKMRWSSLLLELLRKDTRGVCVCLMCRSACVCVVGAVKKGQHSKHRGWWWGFSLCFLLWSIINCSISSALCNPALRLLSLP